jgi:hypothetical protein
MERELNPAPLADGLCSVTSWRNGAGCDRRLERSKMSGIESDMLATFLSQLNASSEVPSAVAEQLSILLVQEKLPKPEELAKLYFAESGEPVA